MEAFEDVGHSDEARSLLKDLYIGDFEKNGVCLPTLMKVSTVTYLFSPPQELKVKPAKAYASSPANVNTAVQQGSKYVFHCFFDIHSLIYRHSA